MKITRNNYEPWFLDYLEGNLDKKMVDEFIEFVSQNPDLREELQLFEPVTIAEDSFCYDGKKKLYKKLLDLPAEFENTAVALLEGDLNPEQAVMFKDYLILHPEKHSELELFRQTKLNPDSTLFFSLKQQLYHQPVFRQLMGWSARVAAVLVLIFTIFTLADQSERNTGKELISSRNPVVSESGVPFKEISVKNNTEPGQLFASSTHKAKPKILKIMHTEESRETAPSLLEDNSAVSINSRIETPVLISAIHGVPEPVSPQLALAEMKSYQNSGFIVGEQPDVRPLSDKLIEKLGLSDIKLTKFVRSGLDLAVKITNDKFSYTRDKSGKVMAYHLDTRLLGFSVPVGNRKEQLALQ